MNDKNQRHNQRMKKKKSVIDKNISRADKEKGLLLILTGNGKGKSTSAFGMVARALGHGMRVGVCQFLKSRTDTGEEAFFKQQQNCDWHVLGDGFTWDTQNREQDIKTSQKGWRIAKDLLCNDSYDLIVLDELTYLLNYDYLESEEVLKIIQSRPAMQHCIVTGRAASNSLINIADTVSEIKDIKHAYRDGVKAQKGVDL